MSESEKKPKFGKIVEGAEQLSLGISIVVAVLLGIGIGIAMKRIFEIDWLLWLGVFWGVGGAALNIYKAYQKQKRELDKLKEDPRYRNYRPRADEDEDDAEH
ncbi:MAG: hypothetical protein B6D59_03285 [Campylobacteraceae bacterium 4484_4]|nr:MAG: hypothetical protein B6D59_03285 [Campylobacteraceae bacterium 4484_4]